MKIKKIKKKATNFKDYLAGELRDKKFKKHFDKFGKQLKAL